MVVGRGPGNAERFLRESRGRERLWTGAIALGLVTVLVAVFWGLWSSSQTKLAEQRATSLEEIAYEATSRAADARKRVEQLERTTRELEALLDGLRASEGQSARERAELEARLAAVLEESNQSLQTARAADGESLA